MAILTLAAQQIFGSKQGLVIFAVAMVLLVQGVFVLPPYWLYLFSTIAIAVLVARSVGLVTGRLGLITLSQMSFAGVGGWVASWAYFNFPLVPFPGLVLIAGLGASPLGMLFGLVSARIRGIEFAVLTLGFAACLDLLLRQGGFPGVGQGKTVLPDAPFAEPRGFFVLCLATLILLEMGVMLLRRTQYALAWDVLRTSEKSAAALGIKVSLAKSFGFAVGAFLAGAAGALFAGSYGMLTTSVFSPLASMLYLATAILCGASLFSGALLSGMVTVLVPELLRRLQLPLDLGNALLALGAFDVLRRGNGGIMEQLQHRMQQHRFRDLRTVCELPPVGSNVSASTFSPESRLEVEHLWLSYDAGQPVLRDVSLTVARGEVHALTGSNGAGKTTLLDAVSGFLPHYQGTVRLKGVVLDGFSAELRAKRGLRRTFQQLPTLGDITVADYLRLAAGKSRRGILASVISDMREFFGLPEGKVPIRLMDFSSRRVLEIAVTLVAKPELVLLDEPAAGLDDTTRVALAKLVAQIPDVFGCAVLLVEHDASFVRVAANRVSVLSAGQIGNGGHIASGAVDALYTYLGDE